MDELFEEIKEKLDELQTSVSDIQSDSFDDGYAEGIDTGHELGMKSERDRIVGMLKMLADTELKTGSANKAKSYLNVIELIRIADEFENNQFVDDDESYGLVT